MFLQNRNQIILPMLFGRYGKQHFFNIKFQHNNLHSAVSAGVASRCKSRFSHHILIMSYVPFILYVLRPSYFRVCSKFPLRAVRLQKALGHPIRMSQRYALYFSSSSLLQGVFFKRNLTNDHRRIILTVKPRNYSGGKTP